MSPSAAPSPARNVINRFVVPLGAMIIAFGAGWSIGASHADTDWADATVEVDGTAATFSLDGSSYQVDGSLAAWVDTDGTVQRDSWPSCLKQTAATTVPVIMATTDVDGTAVTTVVAVDCQAS